MMQLGTASIVRVGRPGAHAHLVQKDLGYDGVRDNRAHAAVAAIQRGLHLMYRMSGSSSD
jgi:hypothetical protein